MSGCAIHGRDVTIGCRGCTDYVEDLTIALELRLVMAPTVDLADIVTMEDIAVANAIERALLPVEPAA